MLFEFNISGCVMRPDASVKLLTVEDLKPAVYVVMLLSFIFHSIHEFSLL